MPLGSQVVKIALQADVGGFVRNFAEADTVAGKFGATLGGAVNVAGAVGSAIDAAAEKAVSAAKKVAGLGASLAVAYTGAGIAAAQFEARLKNVQSLLGEEGPAQFQKNFEGVLKITREFPISANDAAEGLYNITSSGKQGGEALEILEVSARAASAGLTTVEQSSTALMAVLNAYGLGVSKVKDVSDILFQTVNLGVLRFEDLTGILGDTVGSAAAAGVSIDQLGSAIATMTLSGISADEAGTSLNRLIQSLIDPSESLAGALKGMGFESGQAAVEADGLRGVMDRLRVASDGNLATLLKWFPEIRAARGALALMANEGANYARVAGEIEDKQARAGATQRAFAAQAESTAMSFKMLMNSLHAMAIEIGSNLLPPAKAVIDILTGIANQFGNLPAPLKTLISYFGSLSSVMLTLGGIYLAFRLKTLVVDTALNLLGGSMTKVGTLAGVSGARIAAAGTRISDIQGPFRIFRTAASLAGAGIERMSSVLTTGATRVETFGQNMGRGGLVVQRFGGMMRNAAQAGTLLQGSMHSMGQSLLGLVKFAGPIAALGLAMFSAFSQGKAEAEKFNDKIMKDFNPEKPGSVVKNLAEIRKEMKNVQERFDAANEGPISGGFWTQLGKDVGDALTNVVGIDVIKDSTWDNLLKTDKLKESEKKIVRAGLNIRDNATEIWNTIRPDDPKKKLSLTSDELNYIAVVAEKTGIKLSGAFDASAPARQKAVEEILKLNNYYGAFGFTVDQVSEGMIAKFNAMEKAEKKMAEGAADATVKSFDLFKSVDATAMFPDTDALIPMGLQISGFYDKVFNKASTFYNGIEELQKRGADPAVIQKFLQAGPEAAGDVVQAAVEDGTNGLIQVLNNGEKMLSAFSARAAEQARLTQRAIGSSSDELSKLLPAAQQIANETFAQGKLATVDSVAAALSMDPASVDDIKNKFGITIAKTFHFEEFLPKTLGTDVEGLVPDLRDLYNGLVDFTTLSPEAAGGVIRNLATALAMPAWSPEQIAKKREKLDELQKSIGDIPGLGEEQKGWLIDVIGTEEAKSNLADWFRWNDEHGVAFPGGVDKQRKLLEFMLSVVGQPDAVQQVESFSDKLGIIPGIKAIMLSLLGTPEAEAESLRVRDAIATLKDHGVTVSVDNVQAILDAEAAGVAVQQIEGKTIPIDVNLPQVLADLATIQGRVSSIEGKRVGIFLDYQASGPPVEPGAEGMMFNPVGVKKYATGGIETHRAGVYPGRWPARMFAEPETGGESYIPWAPSKRGRSTKILNTTASAFGYDLMPKVGAGNTVSAASVGRPVVVNTQMHFNAPFYGDNHLLNTIDEKIQKHDRDLETEFRRDRSAA